MTAESAVMLNLDGYTVLPPGKIATVVTYLEMRERPTLSPASSPEGWRLHRLTDDRERYRALYPALRSTA